MAYDINAKTYREFHDSWVPPTRMEYWKSFLDVPTWRKVMLDNSMWRHSSRGDGLPNESVMSESEIQHHAEVAGGIDIALSIARSKARTDVGHYLYEWYRHIRYCLFSTYEKHVEVAFENDYNSWDYSRDGGW